MTLTSDFGSADGYVGAMKGVLVSEAPGVTILDLTHEVPRHDVVAAAHALATAVPYFPAGTIHVAVVDPGVGGARRPVVVCDRGQIFVGPDNGSFALVAPAPRAVFEIASPAFRREDTAATFHGRDVFAVAAGRLAAGARPEAAGPKVALAGELPCGGAARPEVQHVDHFGNLVTTLTGPQVAAGARLRIAGRLVERLSRTYEDVAPGQLLAYVGSRGLVEIAIREGSAAEELGAARGAPVELLPPEERR